MILHLIPEEKISPLIISTFEEAFPGRNLFVGFNGNHKTLTYNGNVIRDTEYDIKISGGEDIEAVMLHYMTWARIDFLNSHPSLLEKQIIWIMWGADLYNDLLSHKGFRIRTIQKGEYWLETKRLIRRILRIYSPLVTKREEFIRKNIDVIACISPEYDLAKKFLPETFKNLTRVDFFYYPVDKILGSLIDAGISGNNIWVGNSGSFTNNHELAFKKLRRLEISDRKVISPLSYNGTVQHRANIEKIGHRYFKDKFLPLKDFYPLDKYNKIMLTANVYIFANWRQEALGNIVIALYLGAKVYLSRRSPLFKYFKDNGIYIFEFEKIQQQSIDTPLTAEEKKHNRSLILKLFNKERQIKLARQLITL